MKNAMNVILSSLVILTSSYSFAAGATSPKHQLLAALTKNSAVVGALAEAKKQVGAASCETLEVVTMDAQTFLVIGNCIVPDSGQGEVGGSAQGQIQISGSIDENTNSPMIEKIEFNYAG